MPQVTPVCQELWQLTDEQVLWGRAYAMLALGVVQLVASRGCAQAHLHSAMIQWWTHKHAAQALDASKAAKLGTFIKIRADFINMMYCKVHSRFQQHS